MKDSGFGRRLEQELIRWQERGWVSAEGSEAILADLAGRQQKIAWASSLALAGAMLLGIGVITWFAAHWNEIGKLIKLLLIFIALTGSHVAHAFFLTRGALPKLAQGMSFLSVLFFGAAIMLIGQIYHIDAHFPDGIALWAAGGLLTAWMLVSQPAMLTSIALAALWTGYEQLEYRTMNWMLLCYLALAAVPLIRNGWTTAARGWGALFILWILGWHTQIGEVWEANTHIRLFALQVLGIAGLWAMAQSNEHPFARAVRTDLLAAALIGTFVFTFPDFALQHATPTDDLAPWLAALVGTAAIYAAGIMRLIRCSELAAERLRIGIALATGFALLLTMELIVPRSNGWPALCWNIVFLGVLYWIGDLGIRNADREMVNRAFAGFSILMMARYFDTFWSLLDRSLFFMAGGVLLLAGGGWLERRRRSLVHGIEKGSLP